MSPSFEDVKRMEEFCGKFWSLKKLCGDDPDRLPELAQYDGNIRELCKSIHFCVFWEEHLGRDWGSKIITDVKPAHLEAWRECECRYSTAVFNVAFPELADLADLDLSGIALEKDLPSYAKVAWDDADETAREKVGGITKLMELADLPEQNLGLFETDPDVVDLRDGVEQLDHLIALLNTDLVGVFRRSQLIPWTVLTRAQSKRHQPSISAYKLSLLRNLEHAHRAFVFGASHAAIALSRAALERILCEYPDVNKGKLGQMISSLPEQEHKDFLPDGVTKPALANINDFANGILHYNSTKIGVLNRMATWQEEMRVAFHFRQLSLLIEGVK